ncbi:MAG TPA: hypothetical protein VMU95_08565 [Trebonia sp.]|nr:hypothetical protein [Trebonia sp.]
MPHAQQPDTNNPSSGRRSDAGQIRLQPRDVTGLLTLAEHYAAPYDLLAARTATTEARLRAIVARWRKAGLAATGQLTQGPWWCWLTPQGMRHTGHQWDAAPPPLAHLAHIRAVLACRNWLETGQAWQDGQATWTPDRQIRQDRPATGPRGHLPDAEATWPSIPESPRAGEQWAIEVELTPKAHARTQAIMAGLLQGPYDHVLYLCSTAALNVVTHAAAQFQQPGQPARVIIRQVPPAALMPTPATRKSSSRQ